MPPDNPLHAPLNPAWRALLDRIDDRYDRSFLRRLASYCSFYGVAPTALDDAMLTAFGKVVADAGIARPKQVVRDATRTWNKLVAANSDWPPILLTIVDNRQAPSIRLGDLPSSFAEDMQAFLNQSSGESLFDPRSKGKIGAATRKDRVNKLLQMATLLVGTGRDASTIKKLRDLVEPEAAKAMLEALWRESGGEPNGHHHNRARLMSVIAKYWAFLPPDQIALIKLAESQFRPPKAGMTDRNRARLREFTDDANVRRLVNLPRRATRDLDINKASISDAFLVQSALAVALLLVAPVREKNLASIDLERHIDRVSDGIGFLVFPADEVKNKQDLQFPLPPATLKLLDLYLDIYRPLLLKGANSSKLFVSWSGRQKTPAELGAQIPKFLGDQLGIRLNVHLFRHLAGHIFLRRHPGEYETVRQLLGHASIETTITFYTGLEHAESFKRYDAILDDYRSED
jgi:integrase